MAQQIEINEMHSRMWNKAAEDRVASLKILKRSMRLCVISFLLAVVAACMAAHNLFVQKHTIACPAAGSTNANEESKGGAAAHTEGLARVL